MAIGDTPDELCFNSLNSPESKPNPFPSEGRNERRWSRLEAPLYFSARQVGVVGMPRKLTRQEAHDFLDSKPGWIVLSTLDPDGYPHTVPLGYFRLGDEILMGVRSETRKLRNIQGNPKVSLLLENGRTRKDIKGLMIQGTATLHTKPEETLHYAREAAKRRGVPESELPTDPRENSAYIRVVPHRFRSWDYSADA